LDAGGSRMNKWAFVSDFDGTITDKDFYHFVIEKYFEDGRKLYTKWKADDMKDIDFLAAVFGSIRREKSSLMISNQSKSIRMSPLL
jgi:2-hydroxy-3-keto-5-methylthiopentenyl-1-phosphate phosphatase